MQLLEGIRNVSTGDAKDFETTDDWEYQYLHHHLPGAKHPIGEFHRSGARIMGFVHARYKIIKWLDLEIKGSVDKTAEPTRIICIPRYTQQQAGGDFTKTGIDLTQIWYEGIITGSNSITRSFKIEYRAGTIFQDTKYRAAYTDAGRAEHSQPI